MSIDIYHQIGHNSNWNFESLQDDRTGEGTILAASYLEKEKVLSLNSAIKKTSMFDPQFFLPNIQIRKLSTYDFFPNNLGDGFNTSDFEKNICDECAEKCIGFQLDNDFSKIIIPTRYFPGVSINYISQQQKLFIEPFIKVLNNYSFSKPVLLQIIVNESMIKDSDFSIDLLNWITGIPDISGVYLIADINQRLKQLTDINFLLSYLRFIQSLRQNDLYVLLGYQNTEAILLCLADPNAVTIGSYENVRMFNIRNFEDHENQPTRNPKARLYVSKLMQWIDFNYIGAIQLNRDNDIFDLNKYQALMFQPTFNWHFMKPQLYKHYFYVFCSQIRELSVFKNKERYEFVLNALEQSLHLYEDLKENGILFDQNSEGYHIAPWITIANLFAQEQGWRN